MRGLMMDVPLLISSLIEHADIYHGETEIVSRTHDHHLHRTNYRAVHQRSRQLASALEKLGVEKGDRIATLAWNDFRHVEIYYAVSGMGAICHTLNPRLFAEQLVYIVNHAEDAWIFVDPMFLPLVAKLAGQFEKTRGFVVLTNADAMPEIPDCDQEVLCYEDVVASGGDYSWPRLEENTASSLCYTSGTTGNPKGVLYSHRSTVLHSYGVVSPDTLSISAHDTILPVVPMFHANAWGLPYAAPMCGTKLVMPGAKLDGPNLTELLENEKVTMTAGVPTVWLALLQHLRENEIRLPHLKKVVIGGSAAPRAMIEEFERDHEVEVLHAWGMTETSPLGTVGTTLPRHRDLETNDLLDIKTKQGRGIFGVEMRIVGDDGEERPRDGKAFGELQVRGPWCAAGYFKGEGGDVLDGDGWFATGDVATLDPDGYMQITDRSKDVIKSGGEWISSIDLENEVVAHPKVAEAAVIGVPHPKWDERPLLILVAADKDAPPQRDEILDYLKERIAKWQLPDDVVFVDELPHTATGKISKRTLREQFGDHQLPTPGD